MITLENYYKKTPKFWKRIGDTALFGIPLITAAIIPMPIEETTKLWIIGVCDLFLALIKIITKFIGDEITDTTV